MPRSEEVQNTLKDLLDGLEETIKAAGSTGIPCGHLYAQFMGWGFSLDDYNELEARLIKDRKIVKRGHCLHAKEVS